MLRLEEKGDVVDTILEMLFEDWSTLVCAEPIKSVAFGTDGDVTVVLRPLHLYSAHTEEPIMPPLVAHYDEVRSVAFSACRDWLASGGEDEMAYIFCLRDGSVKRALEGHENSVLSVAFSNDGTLLATGSEDATVRVWDVDTGKALAILCGHASR